MPNPYSTNDSKAFWHRYYENIQIPSSKQRTTGVKQVTWATIVTPAKDLTADMRSCSGPVATSCHKYYLVQVITVRSVGWKDGSADLEGEKQVNNKNEQKLTMNLTETSS